MKKQIQLLLSKYRKQVNDLTERNKGLWEELQAFKNVKPKYEIRIPEYRIKEYKGYKTEYNRNEETIRTLNIVCEELEYIILYEHE